MIRTHKTCTVCKKNKRLSDFYKRRNVPDGRKSLCKECCKEYRMTSKGRASAKKYNQSDKGKAAIKKMVARQKADGTIERITKKYCSSPQGKANRSANSAKYRSAKLRATPSWADIDLIKLFYRCKPKGCHVDHIIPLQGKDVCGLHVENNLQWLRSSDNISKGNRLYG